MNRQKNLRLGFTLVELSVVLVIIGALFSRWGAMAPVLWVLAVLSTTTIIHRIAYTYQQTRIIDLKAAQQQIAAKAGNAKPQSGKGQQQIPSFN